MKRFVLGLWLCVCLSACLGDPVGPRGPLVVEQVGGGSDSLLAGAPGRALAEPITFRVLDAAGHPLRWAAATWTVSGGGQLEQLDEVTGPDGIITAVWVLGTQADVEQKVVVDVRRGGQAAKAEIAAVATPVEVASLRITADTTEVRVAVPGRLEVEATDPFGNRFVPAALEFRSLDTTLVVVDSTGEVVARRRGHARVIATAAGFADTGWVRAIQVVQSIVVDRDTLVFHSIGEQQTLNVTLVDDQGLAVSDSLPVADVAGGSVVDVEAGTPLTVRSVAEGSGTVALRVGGLTQAVTVAVAQQAASIALPVGTISFDALNDTMRIQATVRDSLGVPLPHPAVSFVSTDPAVAAVDPDGVVLARGNGQAMVVAEAGVGVVDSVTVVVSQTVDRVTVGQDTLYFDALNAVLPLAAVARDRLGSPVAGVSLRYATGNDAVASVDANGNVRALGNGATVIVATSGVETAFVVVQVAQRPVHLVVTSDSVGFATLGDTVRFDALGEAQTIAAIAVDSLGFPVAATVGSLVVGDTTVVALVDAGTVRSQGNGVTDVWFTVDSLHTHRTMVVQQVPDTVTAALDYAQPILTLASDAALPLSCTVRDRNGFAIADRSPSVTTSTETVVGTTCGDLRVRRSGLDTLRIGAGTHLTTLPIVVAVRPTASAPAGDFVALDTFPYKGAPWAPSAWINPEGQVELFSTVYFPDSTTPGHSRGDLHRFISADGINFRYDGVVLQRDSEPCSLNGSGIENVTIVPRSDAPGWRMFYAGGSFVCYGWQVFSAVSSDGKTWTKEPGVRLSNGGTVPPAAPVPQPYPVGEGMVVDVLPSGEFRMIVASFEHVSPLPIDTWQITEWRSQDQVNWSYVGTVLTTRDMPPLGQGSVYSPTITELAPGLWRMLFTADNRRATPYQSGVWSAVSTNRETWQVEGQLLGAAGTELRYATMVGNRVFYLRRDGGGPIRLGGATILMP